MSQILEFCDLIFKDYRSLSMQAFENFSVDFASTCILATRREPRCMRDILTHYSNNDVSIKKSMTYGDTCMHSLNIAAAETTQSILSMLATSYRAFTRLIYVLFADSECQCLILVFTKQLLKRIFQVCCTFVIISIG